MEKHICLSKRELTVVEPFFYNDNTVLFFDIKNGSHKLLLQQILVQPWWLQLLRLKLLDRKQNLEKEDFLALIEV